MTQTTKSSRGTILIACLVVALLVFHQDSWYWTNPHLVFGFLPIGIFYHCGISIAAAAVWWLATKIAWPTEWIEMSNSQPPSPSDRIR